MGRALGSGRPAEGHEQRQQRDPKRDPLAPRLDGKSTNTIDHSLPAFPEPMFPCRPARPSRAASRIRIYDPRSVQTVYDAAGGYQGLLRLARAWHAKVMADEVVSHAFSHGFHPQHSERLAAYWAEALGGPTTFSAAYSNESLGGTAP